MRMQEFVTNVYDLRPAVQLKLTDPAKVIMEADALPCDDIKYVDGRLQKVVYIDDEEFMPVLELLSYDEEDIKKEENRNLVDTWYAYMENIEITSILVESLVSISKEYAAKKRRKEELTSYV